MNAAAPTPDRILHLGYAFRGAKALLSAVELGVFTALAEGPLDRDILRRKLGIAERGIRDFLDVLVALGLLKTDHDGEYANTPEADLYLDARKPTYIGRELANLNERMYPHWNLLTPALRTGKAQSAGAGADYFQMLYADQHVLETFVTGMTGGSLLAAKALAVTFPWREYTTLIDIGTAQGCLPVEIAQAHPHLTGTGFDLPQVRRMFEQYVRNQGLADRLQFHPGDFLSDPLPTAEVVVMGRILHNWDLATKKMLLRKAYDALPRGGALVVYERLIDDERRANAAGLLASLNMLIMTTGGFDFTGSDCIAWMRESGLRDMRVESLASGQSMVVGLK
jgi:precorrin-6B methylase 2